MTTGIEKADLEYACNFIKMVCLEIGPGSPGSAGERARASAVQSEFEKAAGKVHR
jgi:hypothetical protein